MDLKKIDGDIKTSYYTLGWFIKNTIITAIASIPLFLWAMRDFDNRLYLVISMLPTIFIISFIADFVRKITKPDAIISNGALDMLKRKIYWSIGPQFIAILFSYILVFILYSIYFEKQRLETQKTITEQATTSDEI